MHIAKAPRANTKTKALLKSLQSRPSKKRNLKKCLPHWKKDKMKDKKNKTMTGRKRKHETLTGICCQWQGSASYDRDVVIETFVLRGNFSGKIATEQQPPNR